jgi:hypothetical protein
MKYGDASLAHCCRQERLDRCAIIDTGKNGTPMTGSFSAQAGQDHFAHCVQVFGGIPATSRRLGIDERAIRRFINGELPVSDGLLADTAKALQQLIAEAAAAEGQIGAGLGVV